jgi:hypothetical protein
LSYFSARAVFLQNYPRLVLVETCYKKGRFVFDAPDAEENLEIYPEDLIYIATKEVPTQISESKMKLLLCGSRYDEWFTKLLSHQGKKIFFKSRCTPWNVSNVE